MSAPCYLSQIKQALQNQLKSQLEFNRIDQEERQRESAHRLSRMRNLSLTTEIIDQEKALLKVQESTDRKLIEHIRQQILDVDRDKNEIEKIGKLLSSRFQSTLDSKQPTTFQVRCFYDYVIVMNLCQSGGLWSWEKLPQRPVWYDVHLFPTASTMDRLDESQSLFLSNCQ